MNVMSVLKAEISRLAKKEAKKEVSAVKKVNATYRSLIAGLRKRIESLEQGMSGLKKMAPKAEKVLAAKTEPEGRFWITGKGVKAMRKRVGLTQAKFGQLVGVSGQTVVNWESVDGKIDIRKKATMARLQQIKGMGKKQVAVLLGEEAGKAPKKVKTPEKAAAKKAKKTSKKVKTSKKAKVAKAPKKAKATRKAKTPKTPKAPKAVEKAPEEKTVAETPAEAKKD